MTKLIYLKILVLVAALEKVGLDAGSAGAAPNAAKAPSGSNSGEQVNLCRTRIHAIIWPDGRKIQEFESGMKLRWQAYNLDPTDIGYMDMEKWLSLHCEVAASARDASASVFKTFVTIVYIDGTKEELGLAGDGTYRFAGQTFASPDLVKAISDLISLANLQPQGP
jgi:hypothetical protein